MSEESSSMNGPADLVRDAEELLQQYFDGCLDSKGAQTLLFLWKRFPQLEQEAHAHFFTEQVFRSIRNAGKTLSEERLDELKGLARNLPDELISPSADTPKNVASLSEIFLDNLVYLEKTGTSLSPPPVFGPDENGLLERWKKSTRWSKPLLKYFPSPYRILIGINLFLLCGVFYGLFHEFRKPETAEPIRVARILDMIDAEWSDGGEIFKSGEELGPDKLLLKSGRVQIEFFSGTKLLLEGPAEFYLNDSNRSFCRLGKMSVEVPPQARGFEISTPFSKIVDLGTEFSLNITENDIEVNVIKGQVEVTPASIPSFKLLDGLAAQVSYKGNVVEKLADLSTFLPTVQWKRETRARQEKNLNTREQLHRRFAEDAAFRFRLSGNTRTDTLFRTKGCQSVRGYLSDEKAHAFKKVQDHIETAALGTTESVTFAALIRLDQFGKYSNTLFLGRDFYEKPGAVLWQIDRNGGVQFHVRKQKEVERYDVPAALSTKDLKTWTMLAMVVDAENKTIRYYKDGKHISSLPWRSEELSLGEATLGNEYWESHKVAPRYLNGAMQDFMIFFRTLNDEEIHDLCNF